LEARTFGSRREAKDWCASHHPGSPIREIGRDAAKPPTRKSTDSSFLATFDEIREAVARRDPPAEFGSFREDFSAKLYEALFAALGAFLAVNLGGLLFLGARGLVRWVRTGYG
jgi:hypothetical protein